MLIIVIVKNQNQSNHYLLEESIQLFNCTDYIPSYITLSDEEIKFVYNLWLYYFSYENMSKNIMRVVTGIKIA